VHLALCADIVLATHTSYLWIPEAKLGIPDVLHYRLIEQRMGRSAAMQMVLLGQKLSAEEAVSRGAIGQTYDDGQTLAEGVADHLSRLRAVSKPVRTAVKTYANTLERRADAPAQVTASAFVLERPGGRR
jgi:enoyl-CoA hydratase/carnithine racemase